MNPIEYLENDILRYGLGNEWTVLFQSRFIIGSEFIIGAFIAFQLFLKRTIRVSYVFLAVYTLYLLYVIIVHGNNSNCGCFGQSIQMTPWQGVFKNVVIFFLTYFLAKIAEEKSTVPKWKRVVAISGIVVGLVLPYILYRADFPVTTSQRIEQDITVSLDLLYNDESFSTPGVDLRQGKHIVVFATLKCSRCIMTVNKLEVLKRNNPELPIYLVLNGEESDFEQFKMKTQLTSIPYAFFNDGDTLVKICGNSFPEVMLLNDSKLWSSIGYTELNDVNLMGWVGEKAADVQY